MSNRENSRKLFRKKELLLLIPLLALAAAVYILSGLFAERGEYAVIELDGRQVERIYLSSLSEPQVMELDTELNVQVELGPDYARVIHSDCGDQTCVRTGKITKSGQSAVCLPAKAVVRLTGGQGFDGETY